MKEIIGDCLAQGIHTPYIVASLLVTLLVGLGLTVWVWLDHRHLAAAVIAQQASKARAETREEERWL